MKKEGQITVVIKGSCKQVNENAEADIEISKKMCEDFGAKLDD
jgi:hypothetical protein